MKLFTKTIYGYKFKIYCIETLEYEAQRMFMIISKMGTDSYMDGVTLNLGITTYTFKMLDNDPRSFVVYSPDYEKDPFKEQTKNLSLALWMQLHQLLFLQEYNVPSSTVRFDTLVHYQEEALSAEDVYLTRSREDDSFFVGLSDKKLREVKTCYLYELLRLRSSLIKAMSIPNGYLVFFHNADVKIIMDDQNKEVTLKEKKV